MDRNAAASLARSLMNQHGLGHVPFEFDRAKSRLGSTRYMRTDLVNPIRITLSANYVDLLPESEIRDVILHEIAHGLAGHKAGHGPIWKAHARRIGCTAMRCATPSARPDGAYSGVCPVGHEYPIHRLPQRVKFCAESGCKRRPYRDRVISVFRDGRPVWRWDMPERYQNEYATLRARYNLPL